MLSSRPNVQNRPPPGYRTHRSPKTGRWVCRPPVGETMAYKDNYYAIAACYGHRRGLLAAREIATVLAGHDVVEAIDKALALRFP